MDLCPCGSNIAYAECCRPLIKAERPALTAEQLMRSRYSAYVKKEMGYIFTSLHPDFRSDYDEKSTRDWAESAEWHAFEILETKKGGPADEVGQVEFIVTFTDDGIKKEHRELSSFRKQDGIGVTPRNECRSYTKRAGLFNRAKEPYRAINAILTRCQVFPCKTFGMT
ncbi:MAG: SEC-C domain-containing protein [Nitrospirae bacterium]|nr:SEC-C domain-containing protein [Nitrospirota bacterium]